MDALNWILNWGFTGVAFTVAIFFLKKWMGSTESSISKIKEDFENFKDSSNSNTGLAIKEVVSEFHGITDNLKKVIESMNKNIASMEKLIIVLDANIKNQQKATEKELNAHMSWLEEADTTLKKHEVEIAKLNLLIGTLNK